jgi:hypothetical protein
MVITYHYMKLHTHYVIYYMTHNITENIIDMTIIAAYQKSLDQEP